MTLSCSGYQYVTVHSQVLSIFWRQPDLGISLGFSSAEFSRRLT